MPILFELDDSALPIVTQIAIDVIDDTTGKVDTYTAHTIAECKLALEHYLIDNVLLTPTFLGEYPPREYISEPHRQVICPICRTLREEKTK